MWAHMATFSVTIHYPSTLWRFPDPKTLLRRHCIPAHQSEYISQGPSFVTEVQFVTNIVTITARAAVCFSHTETM